MRKRLFFDIETSYNLIADFSCGYNKTIGTNQILRERAVICVCYKWEGSKKVYHISWDLKNRCDKKLLSEFIKVANSADELVSHNGDKFDLRFLRGRCYINKLPMLPEYMNIDTLKNSRKYLGLNSHRLDYHSRVMGRGGKYKMDLGDWINVVENQSKSALDKMVRYCKKDVLELESMFNEMKPYVKPKYSIATDRINCPECNSATPKINRTIFLPSGNKKVQFLCKDCYTYYTRVIIEKKK